MANRWLAAALASALTVTPAHVAAQDQGAGRPGVSGDDLVRLNGSWFTTVCETDDPLVRARCDGFIQGVASLVRAQRFSRGCPLEAPAATIRREVMAFLIARPSRSPAAQVVWRAIDTAFPCPPSRLRG